MFSASRTLVQSTGISRVISIGLAAGLVIFGTVHARAVTVGFSGTVDVIAGGYYSSAVTGTGTTEVTSPDQTSAVAKAIGVAAGVPSVYSSSSSVGGGPSANSTIIADYYVSVQQIAGIPISSILFGMNAAGSLTATNSSNGSANSAVSFSFGGLVIGYVGCTGTTCSLQGGSNPGIGAGFNPSSLTMSYSENVDIGQQYLVQLYANSSAGGTYAGSASGYIDPYFFIAPSTPNLDDFSIVVSPGFGNDPLPTPLPAALPLFAAGVGAFSLLGWRRKRKVQVVAA